MHTRVYPRLGLALLATFGLAACEATAPLEPTAIPALSTSSGPVLVECPTDLTFTAEGTIGSTGGEVRVNNHRLAVGKQAVKGPNSFRLTDPASQYMELDLKGNGQDSFGFDKPVQVTIDYSRCTRSNVDKAPLSVWKIDPATKALLKPMGGTDDKTARVMTFSTDSLSAYAIAQ